MSNVGHQQLWVTGSRFLFQRDPIATVVQPLLDFGTVDVMSPTFDPQKIELKDSDGGKKRLIDERVIDATETYTVTCYNVSPDNLAILYNGSVEELTQAITAKTDIKHFAHNGRLVKILDANYDSATPPRFTLGVTSITSINTAASGGGDALVENTDWEWVSKERGVIRILPGSAVVTDTDEIFITYVPRAISGLRLIKPQSRSTAIQGRGMVVWGRENNLEQTARIARFSITAQTPNFSDEEYSSLVFSVSVVEDISSTEPDGRIEYWLGDLPDLS